MQTHVKAMIGFGFILALYTVAQADAPQDSVAEVFERTLYAAEDTVPLGRFEGERETRITPEFKTSAELDRMADEYASRLLEEIKTGRHQLSEQLSDQLRSVYGSIDYDRLKGAPGFRIKLDKYIQEKQQWHRDVVLHHEYTRLHRKESYSIVLDEGGRARVTKSVLHATENDREDELYNLNNSATTVITNDSARTKLRSKLPQAFENHGSLADASVYERAMAGFDPRSAGRATVLSQYRWSVRDVVEASRQQTPEGKGIRLTFFRKNGGVDNVLLLTVLPEKDYLVWEQKEYSDLRLSVTVSHSDYREISDGRWYPFNRSYLSQKGALVAKDVRERVSSGVLSPWSSEALSAADQAVATWIYDDRFTARRVDATPEIDGKEFILELEPGTIIYDMRRLDRSGAPMKAIVSGKTSSTVEHASVPKVLSEPAPSEPSPQIQPQPPPVLASAAHTGVPSPNKAHASHYPSRESAPGDRSSLMVTALIAVGAIALLALFLKARGA